MDQQSRRFSRLMLVPAVALIAVVAIVVTRVIVHSDSRLPPEKQQIVDMEEKLRSDAVASSTPPPFAKAPIATPEPSASPLPDNVVKLPAGAGTIIEEGLAPFPSSAYLFENSWHESRDGKNIIVYAGVESRDRSQGVLVVTVDTLDYQPVPDGGGTYDTPIMAGSVHIVSANGEQLTVATQDGTTFYFDVASRQFMATQASAAP